LSKPSLTAIVDDDQAMREALLDLLHVEGLPGRVFSDAEAFLASMAAEEFGCLITDIRMPGLDGLALQRRLRQQGSPLPVIFVTSAADDASRVQAMADGATAYFTKPLTTAALVRGLLLTVQQQVVR